MQASINILRTKLLAFFKLSLTICSARPLVFLYYSLCAGEFHMKHYLSLCLSLVQKQNQNTHQGVSEIQVSTALQGSPFPTEHSLMKN